MWRANVSGTEPRFNIKDAHQGNPVCRDACARQTVLHLDAPHVPECLSLLQRVRNRLTIQMLNFCPRQRNLALLVTSAARVPPTVIICPLDRSYENPSQQGLR